MYEIVPPLSEEAWAEEEFVAFCLHFEDEELGSPRFRQEEDRLLARLIRHDGEDEDFEFEYNWDRGDLQELHEDLYEDLY